MVDQVRTIITDKWFTAEELDEISGGKKHQNKNEVIEIAFEKAFNACSNSSQMWKFIKSDFEKSNIIKAKRLPPKIISIN